MKRHLIAVDMDGTLLNSKNVITETTLAVLKDMTAKGHLLIPASGRALCLLPKALKELKLPYAITENGALIWDDQEKKSLFRGELPVCVSREILLQTEKLACYVEIFSEGKAYADQRVLPRLEGTSLGQLFRDYMLADHIFLQGGNQTAALLAKAEKINVYFEHPEEGMSFYRSWKERSDVEVTTSIGGNVEFNARGINKGTALRFLQEKLGIPKERCIAFGDNENDLEMFEAAGRAVAMGNAKPHIRARADLIAPTNDEDGVARVLGSMFQEK